MKNLFPVPKLESTRIITLANQDDYISFRHHTYTIKGKKEDDIELEEIGPRFDLRPYQILLGTIDMPDSTKEWVLRPYMNTARKVNYM
jgi:U3 small nucleolar ribonucleoprotein protein IMP4